MRKYTLKALRELVRLGVAEDYTNKPAENLYTLRRLEKVGYSSGVYGINGGLVEDTETGQLYAIIGRCSNLFILFYGGVAVALLAILFFPLLVLAELLKISK